jgi:hypothetical protein
MKGLFLLLWVKQIINMLCWCWGNVIYTCDGQILNDNILYGPGVVKEDAYSFYIYTVFGNDTITKRIPGSSLDIRWIKDDTEMPIPFRLGSRYKVDHGHLSIRSRTRVKFTFQYVDETKATHWG